MKIDANKLSAALELPCSIASNRQSLPILNTVRIEAVNGLFSVRASDLDQEALTECECDGELKPVCVGAKSLRDSISCAGDKLTISMNGGGKIIIKGKSTCEFPTLSHDEFPPAMRKQPKPVAVHAQDLARAIRSVLWAASTNPAEYTLSSVHVVLTPKNIVCEATTRRVLAVCSIPSICAPVELIVPSQFAGQIANELAKDGAQLLAGENAITVKHDTGSYSCKLTNDSHKYPSTKPQLEGERKKVAEIGVEEWLNVFQTACLITPVDSFKDGHKELRALLTFSLKKVLIETVSKESSFQAEIAGKFALSETIAVNAHNLMKALACLKQDRPCRLWRKDDNVIGLSQDEIDVLSVLMRQS